mgnify:CR=1 FL=1
MDSYETFTLKNYEQFTLVPGYKSVEFYIIIELIEAYGAEYFLYRLAGFTAFAAHSR